MTPQKVWLTFCLFAAFVLCGKGFEFHWRETSLFNKQMECSIDANSSSLDIFTIIDLTIFDVTSSHTSVKMAAISILDTDLYVRHASKGFLAVEGSVSQHDAELVVTFNNQTYCSFCSYLCELNFISSAGHPVVRHITIRPTPSESDSLSSEVSFAVVTNRMMAAVDLLKGITNGVEDRLTEMEATDEESKLTLARLEEKLDNITDLLTPVEKNKVPTSLSWKQVFEECKPGMANVTSDPRVLVTVFGHKLALCDTQTEGGGWIIFQRRTNGIEYFYRDWEDYRSGFGDVAGGGDYWLGNKILHKLTSKEKFELHIDMGHEGQTSYAKYSSFSIGSESTNFKLMIGSYSGNTTDQLTKHNGMPFSTHDKDNDQNSGECAQTNKGGWWYRSCYDSNLNGAWGATDHTGINWGRSFTKLLTLTEMKIRRIS